MVLPLGELSIRLNRDGRGSAGDGDGITELSDLAIDLDTVTKELLLK